MKTYRSAIYTVLFLSLGLFSKAQTTQEDKFNVSGNCGMCKTTIEKAAKSAGVEYADWNKETKILTIRYNQSKTDVAKVQDAIAAAGYDNAGKKGDNAAYDKLPACCKYDRGDKAAESSCCADGKACTGEKCQEKNGEKCKSGDCEKCKMEKGKKGEKGMKG